MEIEYFYAGTDQAVQAGAVDMLRQCFDEWIGFIRQYGRRFPFTEHSFVALQDQKIIGHAGVIPFDISDGSGGVLHTAGLASVAVRPEARGCGIAHKLCTMAAAWSAVKNFDLMLLYTGAARVYEKSSWQTIADPACVYLVTDSKAARQNWKSASGLSASEKAFIKECYQALPPLSGRVIRPDNDQSFHSWEWFFSNPATCFKLTKHGYAVQIEDVLCEVAAPAGEQYLPELLDDVQSAFLSPEDPAAQFFMQQKNCRCSSDPRDFPVWHGEIAMQKSLNGKALPEKLYLPLADKF